jgi:hypothetical protein
MDAYSEFATTLDVPLRIINTIGWIVSGIWLVSLGEIRFLGYGFVAFLLCGTVFDIAMRLGMVFASPAGRFHKKGNKLGFYFFGFLCALYTILVSALWCKNILFIFANEANSESIIPILVMSYSVATLPIILMARFEMQEGNDYAMISPLFTNVGYVLVVMAIVKFRITLSDAASLLVAIMIIGQLIQFRMEYLLYEKQNIIEKYGTIKI